MQIGVTFPQYEIGADPAAIREYALEAEDLGYEHLLAYDHVLGADPANREGWSGYSHEQMFHEVFVLFGYLAAIAPRLELVTGVVILPQRQAALVAKQAAQVDVLTGGKFRLGVGVGWNAVEYEALGMNFKTRGKLIEEQVELMRRLWEQEVISFDGKFHRVTEAGINPLPIRRAIPVWMGGGADVLLRRTARLGDGWFPQGRPDEEMRRKLDLLRCYTEEAGRDPNTVGIEARVNVGDGIGECVRQTQAWQALGATHISINTMGAGLATPSSHIEAIRSYMDAVQATTVQTGSTK
ncbi:MAG: LLM class F420-dependent oxidoreductase [Chloroflexota bacterium]|nr:LLM class F420-dependent oxidoreductase [Chloroflexota bacterium]